MAKEISDVVKQCKILLLDIEGTTTSISFVKDKLFPYAEENVKGFLEGQWESEDVKSVVSALRKLALEDEEKKVDGVVTIPGEDAKKEDQIEGFVKSVKWQMSSDRKVGPLKQLQGLIWKKGYESGDIKGHVYDDVLPALQLWRSTENQKIYIYSSGSVQAQKLLFAQSVAGDMLPHIDGHFDTEVGSKQESASYVKIAEAIGCKPEEILFLTDIVKEAEAAKAAGLQAALVSREGNAPLDSEASTTFPVLHSFSQLAASNKRKPETDQAEEITQAAKIPKTDVEVPKAAIPESKVEETNIPSNEKTDIPKDDKKSSVDVEMTVEEITDVSAAAVAAEVVDAEPVVMEVDMVENDKKETETKTNDKKVESDIDITEVEEVTDKPTEEVAAVADVEPVIEEPPTDDTEANNLINVGDVLEKECDDILAKVQNVTNLKNITTKPNLNTISEEMETENTDSNDIADRILDTENDLDLNSDKETTASPTDKATEDKTKDTTETPKTEVESKTETVDKTVTVAKTETADKIETVDKTETDDKTDTANKTETTDKTDLAKKAETVDKTETPDKTESTTEKVEPALVEEPKAAENGKETHVNGTMNGCGDGPEVNPTTESRLSVENGKELNGANGDANGANGNANGAKDNGNGVIEEGQGDAKKVEVPEIKVKEVKDVVERTDPVEQAAEV